MSKGWLIGIGVGVVLVFASCGFCLVLFSSSILSIFALTQPVVDASNEFLGLLGQGKVAEAYASTAGGFRARQTEAAFTFAVKKLEITDFSTASWSNRSFNNNQGSTDGTVTTKKGQTKPVAVKLLFEDGRWKVLSLRYDGVEVTDMKPPPPPMPSGADLRKMTLDTLLDFNDGVKASDFTAFFAKISPVWQKQTSAAELKKSFQDFIDKKIDIAAIKALTPEFNGPATLDEQGVLVVGGHFPTKPARVHFTLRYAHDENDWKLIGVNVRVSPD